MVATVLQDNFDGPWFWPQGSDTGTRVKALFRHSLRSLGLCPLYISLGIYDVPLLFLNQDGFDTNPRQCKTRKYGADCLPALGIPRPELPSPSTPFNYQSP
jgi:hypothetical protein